MQNPPDLRQLAGFTVLATSPCRDWIAVWWREIDHAVEAVETVRAMADHDHRLPLSYHS